MLLEYITEWINEHPLLIEYVLNPCLGVLYSEAWDCLLHTEAGEYSSATTGYRPTNGIFHMRIERRCQFVRFISNPVLWLMAILFFKNLCISYIILFFLALIIDKCSFQL